jgi:hypothetical protein
MQSTQRISSCVTNSRDTLRARVVDGRDITIVSDVLSTTQFRKPRLWNYMLRDASKPDEPTIKVYGAFFDTVSLPTKAEAMIVGEKLCRYLRYLLIPLLEA